MIWCILCHLVSDLLSYQRKLKLCPWYFEMQNLIVEHPNLELIGLGNNQSDVDLGVFSGQKEISLTRGEVSGGDDKDEDSMSKSSHTGAHTGTSKLAKKQTKDSKKQKAADEQFLDIVAEEGKTHQAELDLTREKAQIHANTLDYKHVCLDYKVKLELAKQKERILKLEMLKQRRNMSGIGMGAPSQAGIPFHSPSHVLMASSSIPLQSQMSKFALYSKHQPSTITGPSTPSISATTHYYHATDQLSETNLDRFSQTKSPFDYKQMAHSTISTPSRKFSMGILDSSSVFTRSGSAGA